MFHFKYKKINLISGMNRDVNCENGSASAAMQLYTKKAVRYILGSGTILKEIANARV